MTSEPKSVKGTTKSVFSLQVILILFTLLILTFNVFVLRDQIKQHRQFRFGVAEKKWRTSILNHWKEEIQQYASDTGRLPNSLYDVAIYNPNNFVYAKIMKNCSGEELDKFLSDKEYFHKNLEYAFVKTKVGWSIFELNDRGYYSNRLMMNHMGEIYIIATESYDLGY